MHAEPAAHSASERQLTRAHSSPTQASGQRSAEQRPWQQLWPSPHCESWVHAEQRRASQTSLPGQSSLWQQSPAAHSPPQHTWPAPH